MQKYKWFKVLWFCEFPSKNDNFGAKINILKYLGIQSNFYRFGWVKCGLVCEPPTNGNDQGGNPLDYGGLNSTELLILSV